MDLKLRDVADLLNVSETTIRRWLAEGKLPAYRLNHQYRFNRSEIETWVLHHRVNESTEIDLQEDARSQTAVKGSQQYSLYRAVHKGGVFTGVCGKNKEEIIINAMHQLSDQLDLDGEVLSHLLLDRERLQPTALGRGIAVPHTRDFLLSATHDVIAVAYPKHPIAYGALDGKPVHTLFFLLACSDKHHLHLLAKIAHLSQQEATSPFLEKQPDKETLLGYIKKWEKSLSPAILE